MPLLDAGDLVRARGEYDALVAEGYKPKDIWTHYRVYSGEGHLTKPFAGSLAREAAFKKSLTPAQREIYDRAIAERRERFKQFNAMRAAVRTE